MKKLLFLLVMAGAPALGGCSSPPATTAALAPAKASETTASGGNTPALAPADTVPAAKAAAYECPMQCAGSASDKPGKCPTCGMDRVKKT